MGQSSTGCLVSREAAAGSCDHSDPSVLIMVPRPGLFVSVLRNLMLNQCQQGTYGHKALALLVALR